MLQYWYIDTVDANQTIHCNLTYYPPSTSSPTSNPLPLKLTQVLAVMESKTFLHTDWSYTQLIPTSSPETAQQEQKEQEEKEYRPVSKFPTSIHVELLKTGDIPDPYKGLAEWDVQVSVDDGKCLFRGIARPGFDNSRSSYLFSTEEVTMPILQ